MRLIKPGVGSLPLCSVAKLRNAWWISLIWDESFIDFALRWAFARAGKSRPTSSAMMAITTSSSMSVKPLVRFMTWSPIE